MKRRDHKKPDRLHDPFGRCIDYVRLSVTDRCNMRCFYCMPRGYRAFHEPREWLSFAEIERIIRAFAELGAARVRITGGEPLVRRELATLAAGLNAIPGIDDLSLSTNASLLARQAGALRQAGVRRINVSLDSLKPERFRRITGGHLQAVLEGLEAAKKAGMAPIKINMLAMKDINDDEFDAMVAFCLEQGFTLRFIETMPMGSAGRTASAHYLDLRQVRRALGRRFTLVPGVMPGGGPAHYVRVQGTDLNIGFISPLSQHFCERCNRVRLGADGTLYLCLGHQHRYELRPLLRQGASDEELKAAIREALALKPSRHLFEEKPEQVMRLMSVTGG